MKPYKTRSGLASVFALSSALFLSGPSGLHAEDVGSTAASELDKRAASGESSATDKMSSSFSDLAGSESNSRSLVNGLRSGSDVTLTTQTSEGTPATSTTFTPKTGKMGYGNTYIALGLAQESLKQAGVTDPTAADLQAALNGGTVTTGTGDTAKTVTLTGILAQRAAGQGWGQIAKSNNLNLGQVVSDLRRDSRSLERSEQPGDKPTKIDRPEKSERPEKPERLEKPERPDRPSKPSRP